MGMYAVGAHYSVALHRQLVCKTTDKNGEMRLGIRLQGWMGLIRLKASLHLKHIMTH